MKQVLTTLLVVFLVLSILSTAGAMAAEEKVPSVRVNGVLVDFPDAQPFIDGQDRIVAPVRFIGEALGADVFWDGTARTAILQRDGVRVEIPVDSREMSVIREGVRETVTMDTTAVIREDRMYIPVRYAAEALGAYVDYAPRYKTAGVWQDRLTGAEIVRLQSYPYTQPDYAISYAEAQESFSPDELRLCYGENRDSFTAFTNAREFLYREIRRMGTYHFPALEAHADVTSGDELYGLVAAEAAAELHRDDEHLRVDFCADASCVYQSDSVSGLTTAVRGTAHVECLVSALELTADEIALLVSLGISQVSMGGVYEVDADVHMNTRPDHRVDIHTIVPLGEAQ